ncbi:MAG: NAD(P)-dependent oxidoreductase [Deltaproteobacteria bacterium]|nr:NAD(P)-dependent oxidoreductase [Deltaproteobacteria bacterium]
MRMLVTGAAGFLGSQVVRAAVDRGHEVVGIVRSHARAAAPEGGARLRLVEADLADGQALRRAAADAAPDLALHLAWSIGAGYYDSPDNLTCVGGSLALLRGLADAGCPRVLCVGTHLELAPSDGDMAESHPVAPRGLYATCKDAVHRVAGAYLAPTATSFVWARLFNLYGPGQPDWAFVPSVVRHLLQDRRCPLTRGEQRRGFLHVRDAADAILAVGESPIRGVVHVGSDDAVTVGDLARRVGARLGRTELLAFGAREPSPGDAPRVVPSTRRLRVEIGFRPRVSLDDGLQETIDWWRTRTVGAA